MALPTYFGSGAFAASSGALTPAFPANIVADQVALLVCESENQAISLSAAQGFVEVTNSPQGTGTAGSAGSTRLAVFWKRLVGGDTAPTIADPGDHVTARIHVFDGCKTTGDPWNVTAGGVDTVADTSGSIPGATTTVADCLVVALCSSSRNGTSTAEFSGWSNGDLANVLERTDNTHTQGLGGGHGMATGEKASAGAYGATAVTTATSTLKGMMSIALQGAASVFSGSGAASVTAPVIAAAGLLAFIGAGALTVPQPGVAGSGSVANPITGTGALAVSQPAITSSGTLQFTGSGALLVTPPAIAGSGTQFFDVTGTGALSVPAPVVAGTGFIDVALTGTGALSVAAPSIAGVGELVFAGSGAASVTAPTIAGAGLETFEATGGLSVSTAIAGVGAQTFVGSGALVVSQPVISGGEAGSSLGVIAIHSATVAIQAVDAGTAAIVRRHGTSVMDTYTADNAIGTADSTHHTADDAPMGS